VAYRAGIACTPLSWSDLGVSESLPKETMTLAPVREGLGRNDFDQAIANAIAPSTPSSADLALRLVQESGRQS
jgi:hypothetical protein